MAVSVSVFGLALLVSLNESEVAIPLKRRRRRGAIYEHRHSLSEFTSALSKRC